MSRNQELRKGYKCPYCQKYNEFSVWVFAHWDIEITHTCDCEKVIPLKNGEVIFSELEFYPEDLDGDQAIMYNSLIMVLNAKIHENPDTPIGDVFFEMFGNMMYKGVRPLFLLTKSKKITMKRIQSEITKWVMEIL